MEKYLLFDYNLLLDDEGEDCLDSVIVHLLNPADPNDVFDQEFDHLQEEG